MVADTREAPKEFMSSNVQREEKFAHLIRRARRANYPRNWGGAPETAPGTLACVTDKWNEAEPEK